MLTGMIEVDEFNAFGEGGAEVGPSITRPIGKLDQAKIGPLPECGFYLLGKHRLQAALCR
ncbi:MAG: hypothetical protein ACREQA_04390 [Candidatus Binatia bacterium]